MYKISPSLFSSHDQKHAPVENQQMVFFYFRLCVLCSPIMQLILQLTVYWCHAVPCIMSFTFCFLLVLFFSSFWQLALSSVMISPVEMNQSLCFVCMFLNKARCTAGPDFRLQPLWLQDTAKA